MAPKAVTKKKTTSSTFRLDAAQMVTDKLIVAEHFAEYLKNNLKVKSQRAVKGKLGEEVKISGDAGVVTVTVENGAAPKRQLKYLARRYIKKQALNNYVRVVAPTKDSYQIRYLAANEQADEEAGEDVE